MHVEHRRKQTHPFRSFRGLRVLGLAVLVGAAAPACARQESEPSAPFPQPEEVEFGQPVEIPAGLFIYGAGEEDFQLILAQSRVAYPGMVERLRRMLVMPPRPINLPRFYIDEFEVTNRQFAAFLEATGYRPEQPRDFLKHWDNGRLPDWSWDFPVTWVAPVDGEAYCRWRGGRLPTDEEWEKAARGTDARYFPWGNELPRATPPNVGSGKLEPVGNRPGDVSPYGVYDLTGNVAEFTATVVEFEGHRVHTVRGGSFRGGLGNAFTFSRLLGLTRDGREDAVGFRCAYDRLPGGAAAGGEAGN